MRRRLLIPLSATLVFCLIFGELLIPGSRLLAYFCAIGYTVGPNLRGQPNGIVGLNGHDYAPSIMKDGSVYKMWWCSNNNNSEDIMYATAPSLDGPWTTPISVLQPTRQATFDQNLTCDPSVIRVGSTWYMYYGGSADGITTSIGLATSPNGINWTRANLAGNTQPIIAPARNPALVSNKYGAGQPSVTYVDGKFYLLFTDTTAVGSNPTNIPNHPAGAGQFVLRSPDPQFQVGVEEMRGDGIFMPYDASQFRPYMFFQGNASQHQSDWQYVETTDSFAIADGHTANHIRVSIFNRALSRLEGVLYIPAAAQWHNEGPGLVSSPDKHQVPSPSCGVIPFDIMRPVGATIDVTDLAHKGGDWVTGLSCDCTAAPTLNAPGYPAVEDFNGDNRADLGWKNSVGQFAVRANLGNGNFSGSILTSGASPAPGWETLTADFTGDNVADYADRHIDSGQIWVHRNLGNGSFDGGTWAFGYSAIGANIEVLPGDFNGDGYADLLEHNRKTGQLWVRLNTGPNLNTFVPQNVAIGFQSQAGNNGSDWRIAVADFNGDNYSDIADVHIPTFQFWVHPNVGGLQFSLGSWNATAAFNWSNFTTVFGDFNGDGWADYADVNRGTGEIWSHNNQLNGTFNTGSHFAYGVYPLNHWILGVPVSMP